MLPRVSEGTRLSAWPPRHRRQRRRRRRRRRSRRRFHTRETKVQMRWMTWRATSVGPYKLVAAKFGNFSDHSTNAKGKGKDGDDGEDSDSSDDEDARDAMGTRPPKERKHAFKNFAKRVAEAGPCSISHLSST
jgi:hypothetical protein